MQLFRSFLFASSWKISAPSAARLIAPDGSNTLSPKQATTFFHAGFPGATTEVDKEGELLVAMHGTLQPHIASRGAWYMAAG